MAAKSGRNHLALSEELFADTHRFDFFQAVRILDWMARARGGDAAPRHDPVVGADRSPSQEPVRFRALPSHSFPPAAIREIRRVESGEPGAAHGDSPRTPVARSTGRDEMIVAFLGLFGPQGALPQHYTTLVLDRIRAKDFALRDFLDMFNHRAISLFYRAWEKYRFAIGYERAQPAASEHDEDPFTRCLYSLVGFGTGGLRRRMQFDDEVLVYYGGLFAHYPRSAIALERMLADYLQLPSEVCQFVGQWLSLSPDDRSSLPTRELPEGMNCRLGMTVVVGQRVWDVENRFRIRLGPLSYGEFRRLLPSGDRLDPLQQMVRTYAGPQFDFDVQLVLSADQTPWCRLGGDPVEPSRLGWNTWVRAREFVCPVEDAVFSVEG